MILASKKDSTILLLGDILFLFFTLWLTLLIRFQLFPTQDLLKNHIVPFAIIFAIWILVFYIFDLYKRQTFILKKRFPRALAHAQGINTVIAILFFYFIPYFGITPKIILFIDLVLTVFFIYVWRVYLANFFTTRKKENILVVGDSEEAHEIADEMKNAFDVVFIESPKNTKQIVEAARIHKASIVVLNLRESTHDSHEYYDLLIDGVRFLDLHTLYEEVFERVPLTLLEDNWFLEHLSDQPKRSYDVLKRFTDIIVALLLLPILIFFVPIVWVLTLYEEKGPLFIKQERIGKLGSRIKLTKFRTMKKNDNGNINEAKDNKVTKIGKYLRNSRIDELPQIWNILRGDISLIGPRPEFYSHVEHYRNTIPYYDVRHLIKPGLSGWAQIYGEHPHHNTDVALTRNKLSYDLYYIKNRGILTDLIIALKTLQTLILRSGS